MGEIVIACYRPKLGGRERLLELTRRHVEILREQKLATGRAPIVMEAADGTILEVFEWMSADAIDRAHANPAVLALWEEYGAVCDFVPLTAVAGTDRVFPGFKPVPL